MKTYLNLKLFIFVIFILGFISIEYLAYVNSFSFSPIYLIKLFVRYIYIKYKVIEFLIKEKKKNVLLLLTIILGISLDIQELV